MSNVLKYDKLSQFKNLIHGSTLKNSIMPYEFSLAFHTGENIDKIIKNRNYLLNLLGIDKDYDIILANQTHSDNIVIIEKKETLGWNRHNDAIADCDALITNQKNIIIGILTADCVPILLYDKSNEVIAAIHAGWKGSHKRILFKTIKKISEVFGSNPKDIYAVIGPSIGICCYEVGVDVACNFANDVKIDIKNEKFMIDLKRENYNQLIAAGVDKLNIEVSDKCTSCENDRFFSYRKEHGCSGRFLTFIGMK